MKRTAFLITLIVSFSTLLSGCAGSKYTTWLTFRPADSTTVTAEDLKLAQRILQERLEPVLLGTATVRFFGNKLRVGLTEEQDSRVTKELATAVGVMSFFHSDKPVEAGSPVPSDAWIVLIDKDIDTAGASLAWNEQWGVDLTLTPDGKDKLAAYTASHIGSYLVIARDGVVIMSPVVQSQITDGQVLLSGDLDEETAKVLAAQANSGRLPFQLVFEE